MLPLSGLELHRSCYIILHRSSVCEWGVLPSFRKLSVLFASPSGLLLVSRTKNVSALKEGRVSCHGWWSVSWPLSMSSRFIEWPKANLTFYSCLLIGSSKLPSNQASRALASNSLLDPFFSCPWARGQENNVDWGRFARCNSGAKKH